MSVIDRFPDEVRDDVRTMLLKLAPPELLYAFVCQDRLYAQPRSDLANLLGGMQASAMRRGDDHMVTPESDWFLNIMDFVWDRLGTEDEPVLGRNLHQPAMLRPAGVDVVLDRSVDTGVVTDSQGRWSYVVGRPGQAVLTAARQAPGGWVVEVDTPVRPGLPVTQHDMRGAWRVGEDGRPTGHFDPNPAYEPSRYASSILAWLPNDMAVTVTKVVERCGTPGLLETVLGSRWLLAPQREQLVGLLRSAATGAAHADVRSWLGRVVDAFEEHWPGDGEPLEPQGYYAPGWEPVGAPPSWKVLDAALDELPWDGDVDDRELDSIGGEVVRTGG